MACVNNLAAVKKEAELYASQGLYREALDRYGLFLVQTGAVEPGLRRTIEAAMARIRVRMNAFEADEDHLLCDPAITRIKKGWRGASSHTDMLVSAEALRDIGLHGAAFSEYRALLMKKNMTAEVAQGVTDCIVHLVEPDKFARAIDLLAGEIFQFPKNILMFKVLIAMNLDADLNPQYFEALYRHLAQVENAPAEIHELIQNLGRTLKQISLIDADEDAYGPIYGLDGLYSDWIRNDNLPPDD